MDLYCRWIHVRPTPVRASSQTTRVFVALYYNVVRWGSGLYRAFSSLVGYWLIPSSSTGVNYVVFVSVLCDFVFLVGDVVCWLG